MLPCAHATYARQNSYHCASRGGAVVHRGVCRHCPERQPAASTGDPLAAIRAEIASVAAALDRMRAARARPCDLAFTAAHLAQLRAQLPGPVPAAAPAAASASATPAPASRATPASASVAQPATPPPAPAPASLPVTAAGHSCPAPAAFPTRPTVAAR
jgi:hypothetical protein